MVPRFGTLKNNMNLTKSHPNIGKNAYDVIDDAGMLVGEAIYAGAPIPFLNTLTTK